MRGGELGICQCVTMTIISPLLSLLHPTIHPPLRLSLPPSLSVPVCLHAGVLSVSRLSLFMLHGSYLPMMIPLWSHEARQREQKKKSH